MTLIVGPLSSKQFSRLCDGYCIWIFCDFSFTTDEHRQRDRGTDI